MKIKNVIDWKTQLGLTAHPEGGYYKEIYRHPLKINSENSEPAEDSTRNLATSIYFLLENNQVSKLHQLKSDEIWYFHTGHPLLVHTFYKNNYTCFVLGDNPLKGEQLQIVLPAGSIFGAELMVKNSFSLMGCMVAPGFHFNDFKLIPGSELLDLFSAQKDIIYRLT